MKDYRFYADYSSKAHKRKDAMSPRYKRSEGPTPAPAKNVIAVYLQDDVTPWRWDGKQCVASCACGVLDEPNSCVATSSVSLEYLTTRTRRISEAEARRIHPRMFEYLEYEPETTERHVTTQGRT